jgi:hypothetical protein
MKIGSKSQVIVDWLCDEKKNPVSPSLNGFFYQEVSLECCIRGIDVPATSTWEAERETAIREVREYRNEQLHKDTIQKTARRKKAEEGVADVESFDGPEIKTGVSRTNRPTTFVNLGISKGKQQPSEADEDGNEDKENFSSDEEEEIAEAFPFNDKDENDEEDYDSSATQQLTLPKQTKEPRKRKTCASARSGPSRGRGRRRP